MMNCRDARKVMQDMLARTAAAEQAAILNGHMMECTRCAHLCEGLTETAELVSRLRSPEVSAEFDEAFAVRLRAAQRSELEAEPKRLQVLIRAAAAVKHFAWPRIFVLGASVIIFVELQAQSPQEIQNLPPISKIHMLAMLAIMTMVTAITRSMFESDLRFTSVFRRLMK
jgi:predicted anti-sigma-YlaC factor YlaD